MGWSRSEHLLISRDGLLLVCWRREYFFGLTCHTADRYDFHKDNEMFWEIVQSFAIIRTG